MMVKARVSRLAMGGWSAIWGYVRFGGAGRKVRAGGCKPQALTPQVVGCQAVSRVRTVWTKYLGVENIFEQRLRNTRCHNIHNSGNHGVEISKHGG